MTAQYPTSSPDARGRPLASWAYPVFAILAVNFLANYLLMAGFGFYEDDYYLTIPALNWSGSEFLAHLRSALFAWPQGRPISWFLLDTFSYLIGQGRNLQHYYVFSLFLTSGVAVYLYVTLKRFVGGNIALWAALFYVLYPLDTGKQIFMHQAYVPVSALGCLLAINAFGRSRFVLFHICAALVFLNYEPYFLIFFFVPLLRAGSSWRETGLSLAKHGVVLVATVLVLLVVRGRMGESRALDVAAHAHDYIPKALAAPFIGSWTVLVHCITRSLEAFLHSSPWQWVVLLAAAGIIFFALRAPTEASGNSAVATPPARSAATRFILAGLGMFAAVYLYRFYPDYYPPNVNIGRLSAMHAAGAFGFCFALTGLLEAVARSDFARNWRGAFAAIGCLYLGSLVSFGLEIQSSQYVRNWAQQTAYFREVLSLVPDLRDGEDIFVNIDTGFGYDPPYDARPRTEGFPPFWMVNCPTRIFSILLRFPPTWHQPPRLFGVWTQMGKSIAPAGLHLGTPPFWVPGQQPTVSDGGFVLLEWENGHLRRSTTPFVVDGRSFAPRPLDREHAAGVRDTTFVYRMFDSAKTGQPLWPTLTRSINYPRK